MGRTRKADSPQAMLQKRLDAVNAGADPAGAQTLRALANPASHPAHVGRYLSLLNVTSVMFTRVGSSILAKTNTKDQQTQRTLDLVNLIGQVGPDRVRECRLPECDVWFIATRRQLYCSPKHNNLANYNLWVQRHKPKKTKRGGRRGN